MDNPEDRQPTAVVKAIPTMKANNNNHHHHHHHDPEGVSGATESTSDDDSPRPIPRGLRWVPKCLRFDGPPEATGLAFDFFGRSTLVMTGVFLAPALLKLSSRAAGCDVNDVEYNDNDEADGYEQSDNGDVCEKRIYGMKPSSWVTGVGSVCGILVACAMPFIGACLDHTPYRKQAAYLSVVALIAIAAFGVLVSNETWFILILLQPVTSLLYNTHIMATYAYSCELSSDYVVQTRYNTAFTIAAFVGTIYFTLTVLILSFALDADDVGSARVSQLLAVLTSIPIFGFVWTSLFRDRPALSQVPPGMSLATAGFRRIFLSVKTIHRDFPAVRYLMLAIMFNEPAMASLVFIFTTFMSQFLGMDAQEIGVVVLVILVAAIPGGKIGEFLALKFNPLSSAKIMVVHFIITTSLGSILLSGPDRKNLMPVFAVFWGIGLGGLHPQHITIFVTTIPRGQETELMGTYMFAGATMSWLPPLVFTALNEAGMKMTIGMASIVPFFLIGLYFLSCVGNYHDATIAPLENGHAPEEPFFIHEHNNNGSNNNNDNNDNDPSENP